MNIVKDFIDYYDGIKDELDYGIEFRRKKIKNIISLDENGNFIGIESCDRDDVLLPRIPQCVGNSKFKDFLNGKLSVLTEKINQESGSFIIDILNDIREKIPEAESIIKFLTRDYDIESKELDQVKKDSPSTISVNGKLFLELDKFREYWKLKYHEIKLIGSNDGVCIYTQTQGRTKETFSPNPINNGNLSSANCPSLFGYSTVPTIGLDFIDIITSSIEEYTKNHKKNIYKAGSDSCKDGFYMFSKTGIAKDFVSIFDLSERTTTPGDMIKKLNGVLSGKDTMGILEDISIYDIAVNDKRIYIRDYINCSSKTLSENLQLWFSSFEDGSYIGIYNILKTLISPSAKRREDKKSCIRSEVRRIFKCAVLNLPIPISMFLNRILMRYILEYSNRKDQSTSYEYRRYTRTLFSFLKIIMRSNKMNSDEKFKKLGELFSVFESIVYHSGINTDLKCYFSRAMQSPASVFPDLWAKLLNANMRALERNESRGKYVFLLKKVTELFSEIGSIPKTSTHLERASFVIGHAQERVNLFKRIEEINPQESRQEILDDIEYSDENDE